MNLIEQFKTSLESQTHLREADLRTLEGATTLDGATWKGVLYPALSWKIVGAAIEVHKHLGPGHLESVYQRAMLCELRQRGLTVRSQVSVPMFYKGERVGDFFADLIVDDTIILELKAVERLLGIHTAQLLTYLRATELRLGLLMNFNVTRMVHGVHRVID